MVTSFSHALFQAMGWFPWFPGVYSHAFAFWDHLWALDGDCFRC